MADGIQRVGIGRPVIDRPVIDRPTYSTPEGRAWLRGELSTQGKSQRDLAAFLNLSEDKISSCLQQRRRWQPHEIRGAIDFLEVEEELVLSRLFGIKSEKREEEIREADSTASGEGTVPVVGWIGDDLKARTTMEGLFGARHVNRIAAAGHHAPMRAYRIQAPNALEHLNGGVVYVLSAPLTDPETAIRRIVLAATGDKGGGLLRMGILRRGVEAGHFGLANLNGETLEANIKIERALLVVAITLP